MPSPLNKYVADNFQDVDTPSTNEQFRKQLESLLSGFLHLHDSAFVEPKVNGRRTFLFHSDGKSVMATKRHDTYGQADCPGLKYVRLPENTIVDNEYVPATQTIFGFDLLYYNGNDFRDLPLRVRKGFLQPICDDLNLKEMPYVEVTSVDEIFASYQHALFNQYEGVVVKAPDARYKVPHTWIALKHKDAFPAYVIDYKPTETTEKTGRYVTYRMGVRKADGSEFHLCDASSAKCTCKERSQYPCPYHRRDLIKPGVVLELEYQPTPGFEAPRHPTILRIRDDMEPEECTIDQVQVEVHQ